MRKNYLIILFLFSLSFLNAQDLVFDWVKSTGGYVLYGNSICLDNSGNIYTTGSFRETADFNPGNAVYELSSMQYSLDMYIQKLSANGNFLWAKSFGGNGLDEGLSITTDVDENVLIVGIFEDTLFSNSMDLISNGQYDMLIQKLDENGNHLWSKSIGGAGYDIAHSIVSDSEGNVYITGLFQDTVDFDPGPDTSYLNSAGQDDIFILKLDASGNFVWAIPFGSSTSEEGYSIAIDESNNLYVTGNYRFTIDFDPGSSVFNLYSLYDAAFILKLNGDGEFIFAKSISGTGAVFARDIAIDASRNIYLTGDFKNTVDFDPGEEEFNLNFFFTDPDVFVLKLDSLGDFEWAKAMGNSETNRGLTIQVNAIGNVFTAGYYEETVDFDPGPLEFTFTSTNSPNPFIQILDSNGDFVWASTIDTQNGVSRINSIALDSLSQLFVTGYYGNPSNFNPAGETFNLTPIGAIDAFVMKYRLLELGIEDRQVEDKLQIYPNPTNGIVNLDFQGLNNVSIKVISLNGQVIYFQEEIHSASHQFTLEGSAGVYILEVTSEGERFFGKIFKE